MRTLSTSFLRADKIKFSMVWSRRMQSRAFTFVWRNRCSILTFFSAIECGWLGVSTTCAFILGNLFGGQIGERIQWMRQIQKEIIFFFLFDMLLFLLALTFSLTFFGYEPILPRTFDFVCITITFAGFFLGCINPFLYELSVEMTFPISENVSSLLNLLTQTFC